MSRLHEAQALKAIGRIIEAEDPEPGTWLLIVGPTGNGFTMVAEGRWFTEADEVSY